MVEQDPSEIPHGSLDDDVTGSLLGGGHGRGHPTPTLPAGLGKVRDLSCPGGTTNI